MVESAHNSANLGSRGGFEIIAQNGPKHLEGSDQNSEEEKTDYPKF